MNKLLACTTTLLLLLLGAEATLADDRNHRDRDRGYDRHDSRGYERRDERRDDRYDNRRHDHDNVSFNVNFVNSIGYRGVGNHRWREDYRDRRWNNFGVGIGYTTFGVNSFDTWGSPYNAWGYNNRQPVVVYQNTYIDNPAPRTTVITRSAPRSGTSLLRDVQGRCFERETDRNGNESRTELPASACNF